MPPPSPCRIAVVIRAHFLSNKLSSLCEALAGHELFDTYVLANEERGPLAVGPHTKIPYDLDAIRELGFQPESEYDVVYCSDVLFEHLRRRLPGYAFYVMVEFDVDLTRERGALLDDLARKLAGEARDLDMAGTEVSRRGEGWAHHAKASRLFRDVQMVFFPFVVLSQRAILHLYRARLAEGPGTMPMQERVFCEAFVASALVPEPAFRCADLNDLLPGCYERRSFYWGLPMLHGGSTSSAAEMSHPVYSGPDFLEAHFKEAGWTGRMAAFRAMLDPSFLPLPENLLRAWRDRADDVLRDMGPSQICEPALQAGAPGTPLPVILLVDSYDRPVREETETGVGPRSMTTIEGAPLIEHALAFFVSAGCSEFIVPLAPGTEEVTIRLQAWADEPAMNGGISAQRPRSVRIVEVPGNSSTSMRIKAAAQALDRRFVVAFGHVVSDIDLQALLAAHERSGKLATVTAVQPAGMVVALDRRVPALLDRQPYPGALWTDGGYTVFEARVLDFIQDEDRLADGDLLSRLDAAGQLAIFEHKSFWQSANTARETELLRRMLQAHPGESASVKHGTDGALA